MKKLLKSYGFTDIREYYEMILLSVINGQIKQCKDQFLAMPKVNKLDFITTTNLTERQKNAFIIIMIKL